jgi:hypothetical protein
MTVSVSHALTRERFKGTQNPKKCSANKSGRRNESNGISIPRRGQPPEYRRFTHRLARPDTPVYNEFAGSTTLAPGLWVCREHHTRSRALGLPGAPHSLSGFGFAGSTTLAPGLWVCREHHTRSGALGAAGSTTLALRLTGGRAYSEMTIACTEHHHSLIFHKSPESSSV